MASGSIRITNIPVTLGGTTYTLGATATWSSSRSGNTVTVSGKVTTDSTAGYINQISSSYAVTCDIKFGSNSAKTITLKEGSNVDTILNISANYRYSYTVDAGSTQSTIKFTVNHANNSGSGTGSGTVTYPVGYTAITAPSKIRPANIKCPWRQGVYKWVWTAGKAGTNNAIKTVQLQYRLYDSSKESWGDWKNLATVSASQTNYEWTKNIDDGDALRLRIVTTPTHGDAVTTTEEPTWDGSNNLDYATYYQTENTAIGTPTLSVTSPIAANGSSTITVSSTHGTVSPSLFYSNSSIGIKYKVTRSDNNNVERGTMTGPIKGTKSYSFTWNGFPVGKAVTIAAEVDDGWTTKTVTKTVVCGKVLTPGSLRLNGGENGKYESFIFTIDKPLVDSQALAEDVNVTYTILGSYSSTENYKELYSVTQPYGTDSPPPSITLTKADVVNGLGGVPNTSETVIYFIARYNVTGFSAVTSNPPTSGQIKWEDVSSQELSVSKRDGSNEHSYYRKEENTPVGPVAIRNITVSGLSQNYRYIINGTAYTGITEATIDISNMPEGYVTLSYQIQEIIGNYFMTLASRNINDAFYKINDTNNGQYTLNMNSTDTTIFGSPNQLTFNLNYNLARPIRATITFNLNGKEMLQYSNDIANGEESISYILDITQDDGTLPTDPTEGYQIEALTKGSSSQPITNNNSLIINKDAGGNVLNIKISGVELFSYTNSSPSYAQENSAYSPMNLLDYTYANFSTIDLPRIIDKVIFITGREGRTNG